MQEPKHFESAILKHRKLSETGYELTLERKGMPFTAGQLVSIHGEKATDERSYSVASGEPDDFIQILYRRISSGSMTPRLSELKEGDSIKLSGPYGQFTLRDPKRPVVFVATGTGLAPCRSYLRSHPDLNLTIVHGVRTEEELFYRDEFSSTDYHPCLSRVSDTEFSRRVTDFIGGAAFDPASHFYLCGAFEMIFDVHKLLLDKGVEDDAIFTEEYYYRFNA